MPPQQPAVAFPPVPSAEASALALLERISGEAKINRPDQVQCIAALRTLNAAVNELAILRKEKLEYEDNKKDDNPDETPPTDE